MSTMNQDQEKTSFSLTDGGQGVVIEGNAGNSGGWEKKMIMES